MLQRRSSNPYNVPKHIPIDFEKYKINGVSHFYALFALASYCVTNQIAPENVSPKLNSFFDSLRSTKILESAVKAYRESMQANTRSKGQRIKRINALIEFCAC